MVIVTKVQLHSRILLLGLNVAHGGWRSLSQLRESESWIW